MTYTKPSLVYRMLRWLMGEENFRRGLRHYYQHNALRHVREADLMASMEVVHAEDLDWFFQQWIHTTETLDYRLGEVSTAQSADGSWQTRVEVIREGGIYMPVDLRVGAETQRLDSREPRQVVTVNTRERPAEVALDPEQILLDIDPSNNARRP
jgi:aminopeptidase N